MSRTTWILIISLGLATTLGIYIGVRIWKGIVNDVLDNRTIDKPPIEYIDLLKGADSGSLQFLKAKVKQYRNPIAQFRYKNTYEILETRLNFSDTVSLGQNLEIVPGKLSFNGRTDSYEAFPTGKIVVSFRELNPRDSSFKKVSLIIEGKGFENAQRNDSVVSYFMEKGSFGISGSPIDEPSIFSANHDNRYSLDPSEPTVLLFKRRGKSLFMLVASPISEQTELPKDLLIQLTGDKL